MTGRETQGLLWSSIDWTEAEIYSRSLNNVILFNVVIIMPMGLRRNLTLTYIY